MFVFTARSRIKRQGKITISSRENASTADRIIIKEKYLLGMRKHTHAADTQRRQLKSS